MEALIGGRYSALVLAAAFVFVAATSQHARASERPAHRIAVGGGASVVGYASFEGDSHLLSRDETHLVATLGYGYRAAKHFEIGALSSAVHLHRMNLTALRLAASARTFATPSDAVELGFAFRFGAMLSYWSAGYSDLSQSFRGATAGLALDARFWLAGRDAFIMQAEAWFGVGDPQGPPVSPYQTTLVMLGLPTLELGYVRAL